MLCEKHDNTMSERPTPETDTLDCELHNPKVLSDRYSIMRDHSNNLERQRNNLQDQRDFAMGEIQRLRKERDEARNALQKVASLAHGSPDKTVCIIHLNAILSIAVAALKHEEAAK